MSRLTRDGTAEPASRDQFLRCEREQGKFEREQGNVHFRCSADHEQSWQPYPVAPYSCCFICDDSTYILAGVITDLPLLRDIGSIRDRRSRSQVTSYISEITNSTLAASAVRPSNSKLHFSCFSCQTQQERSRYAISVVPPHAPYCWCQRASKYCEAQSTVPMSDRDWQVCAHTHNILTGADTSTVCS